MKYTDLKLHDTYTYEVKEWGVLYGEFSKYEDALEHAKYLFGAGQQNVVIVSKKFQEFALTTSEDIKKAAEEDILTLEVSDVEYAVEQKSVDYLEKLAALMNKYEIASFKLDLGKFKLLEEVKFVQR